MDDILNEERFNFISSQDRAFILAFNDEMTRLGFDYGGKIGSGYCWGKYMIIYRRSGVKSETVYARIYIRDTSIVLRLFLSGIDKHREYIERAPAYIKNVFTGPAGDCNHDRDDGGGKCNFRKTYTLDGRLIEKCSGIVFEFYNPTIDTLPDFIALLAEFFPGRKTRLAPVAA